MQAVFRTNLVGLHFTAVLFYWKELMKQAGWTVTQSSDGTTWSRNGDVITHTGTGPGGMRRTGSWFVLQQPLVRGARREICVRNGFSVAHVRYSKGAGFTGGNPDATTPPQAADQSPELEVSRPGQNAPITQIMAQSGGGFGFWFAIYNESGQTLAGAMLDPLAEGTYPEGDPDPYVFYTGASPGTQHSFLIRPNATNDNHAYLTNTNTFDSGPHAWMDDNHFLPVSGSAFIYMQGATRRYLAMDAGPHPVSGETTLLPVIYGRAQSTPVDLPNGVKGVSTLLRYVSENHPVGSTTPDKLRIHIGNVSLPWDGVTTPSNGGGTYVVRDLWPSADPNPPEAEIISPPVGTKITPATPIKVQVTDDSGLGRVLIYAKYAGQIASEVIHDGGTYLPPYTDSTRVAIPNGWLYTLRRTDGWPGPIALYVRATDTSGNEVQIL